MSIRYCSPIWWPRRVPGLGSCSQDRASHSWCRKLGRQDIGILGIFHLAFNCFLLWTGFSLSPLPNLPCLTLLISINSGKGRMSSSLCPSCANSYFHNSLGLLWLWNVWKKMHQGSNRTLSPSQGLQDLAFRWASLCLPVRQVSLGLTGSGGGAPPSVLTCSVFLSSPNVSWASITCLAQCPIL